MPEGCHASPVLQDNIGLIFFEEFFIMDMKEEKIFKTFEEGKNLNLRMKNLHSIF